MIIHEKGYEGKNKQDERKRILENNIGKKLTCDAREGCGTILSLTKEDSHLMEGSSKPKVYYVSCPVCLRSLVLRE